MKMRMNNERRRGKLLTLRPMEDINMAVSWAVFIFCVIYSVWKATS